MKSVLLMLSILSFAAAAPPLVPLPAEVKPTQESFVLDKNLVLGIVDDGHVGSLFGKELRQRIGEFTYSDKPKATLMLVVDSQAGLPKEGYRLRITSKEVEIKGADAAGLFYGTRTFLQMLPPVGDPAWKDGSETVAGVEITDAPRFAWRGMMLDTSRHLYPLEDLKKFIDWMAYHKLNTFHWHLTDDQGWRLEIKKYPKLTEVGAWRDSTPPYGNRTGSDGKRYGGFYTQAQVKELVAYAKERHVTIVPEIEMPGHASAALASYPEFGNKDVQGYAPKVATQWGVLPYTFAPTEETFRFLEDVLTEVCELFPSQYIHIGGDEAPKDQWHASATAQEVMKREKLGNEHDLQSYFIRRVEKILSAKGRKLIGWDEIREGGLSPEATVMAWRGEEGGIASAKEGHDVVMAPNSHMYFDHYQAPAGGELSKGAEFEAIGGNTPVEKVYSYDPVPKALDQAQAKHILGVQAQLWSEYMKDWNKVEYMAFPRIAALAEVAWTDPSKKNYDDFRTRLSGLMEDYDAAGIHRAEVYEAPQRKTRDGSSVETTLPVHADHYPEFAYDGRADTFFWAARALNEGDTFALHLKSPVAKDTPVKIVTGGTASANRDALGAGVLEITKNGNTWEKIADFKDSTASGTMPAGTMSVRLRVTQPQTFWLILHEIEIGL